MHKNDRGGNCLLAGNVALYEWQYHLPGQKRVPRDRLKSPNGEAPCQKKSRVNLHDPEVDWQAIVCLICDSPY